MQDRALSVLVGAALLGVVVAGTQCAQSDQGISQPSVGLGPISPARAQAIVNASVLPHGRESLKWMAEIHTLAMQEAMSHGAEIRRLSPAARCERIVAIARKFIPKVRKITGVNDPAFYEDALAKARDRSGCASSTPLSMWGYPVTLSPLEEYVTGEFLNYTPGLASSITEATSPSDVAARMDAVLVSAASLPAPDFEVLAGIAAAATSSVYYWYEVEQAGGGGPGDEQLMSLFRPGPCGFWCRVGWSDPIGSVGGAAAVVYTSGGAAAAVPQAVLAGALIGMVVNSATTALT